MEFLKNHYEKLILGVVLIALAASTAMVSMNANTGEGEAETLSSNPYEAKAEPLDLTTNMVAYERLTNITKIDLSGGHYLFNPFVWQRKPDGSLITGSQLGVNGVKVTRISPLVFSVIYADHTSGEKPRYTFRITRVNPPDGKASTLPTAMSSTLMSPGEENDHFRFLEARGAGEDTQVVLEMKKDNEQVILSRGKKFERIDGYIADLRYDPENKNFNNVREKSSVVLSGETNNIVAVDATDIVLLSPSTTLKTTLKYNAAP